jgi:hypothetical protein
MSQSTIELSQDGLPESDIVVCNLETPQHRWALPQDVLLLIEVSDTTLVDDRNRKPRLYARDGIRECWIVNLTDARLEVYRDPSDERHNTAFTVKDDAWTATAFPEDAIRLDVTDKRHTVHPIDLRCGSSPAADSLRDRLRPVPGKRLSAVLRGARMGLQRATLRVKRAVPEHHSRLKPAAQRSQPHPCSHLPRRFRCQCRRSAHVPPRAIRRDSQAGGTDDTSGRRQPRAWVALAGFSNLER